MLPISHKVALSATEMHSSIIRHTPEGDVMTYAITSEKKVTKPVKDREFRRCAIHFIKAIYKLKKIEHFYPKVSGFVLDHV